MADASIFWRTHPAPRKKRASSDRSIKKDQPDEKNSPQGATRRGFLSGVGTAVVSTAVIPALAATSAEAATPARSDDLEEITLTVNGTNYPIAVDARWTLAEVLRDHLGLTGTKIGCNAGECGACTVMVEGKAVYSCSQLALWMDGKKITTVEGLASAGQLDLLQKASSSMTRRNVASALPGN